MNKKTSYNICMVARWTKLRGKTAAQHTLFERYVTSANSGKAETPEVKQAGVVASAVARIIVGNTAHKINLLKGGANEIKN